MQSLFPQGALLQSILSFRRSGWQLGVSAWWDVYDNLVHVEIINIGRQSCVISEIRYFVSSRIPSPKLAFGQTVFFDHDVVTQPIAPSAKIEITRGIKDLPETFSLEVWVWTAGRPYKSQKWIVDPRTIEWEMTRGRRR